VTDRLELLQSAAHALREAAATPPEQTPPLAQLVEDTRCLRILAEAAGQLAGTLGTQLGAVDLDRYDGKNRVEATDKLGSARACVNHSSRDLARIAATLQAGEINLARVPAAPSGPPDVKLNVVPHDVDACQFCANPAIRAGVLAEQGDTGWQCSKCGWATTDLGTMHEAVWTYSDGLDTVCPGCGADGAFVDYPRGD
jgi:hypothetical protein